MDREVSHFGGAAGRILRGAFSLHSLVTGLALGLFVVAGIGILIYAKAHVLVAPFFHVTVALTLARFVLNGQFGEWEGTLFSGVGGPWTSVALVAARYLLLTFLWLAPMMLFGLRLDQAALTPEMLGGKPIVLLSLYVTVSALSPPLFLIASLSAADFGELFSAAHWGRVFGGRLGDLLTIYAAYSGGVTIAILLCFPVIALGFQPNRKVGMLVLGLAGGFMLGLCTNLLGRLCGFYALGDFTQPIASEPLPAAPPEPDRCPTDGGAGPRPVAPSVPQTGRVSEPIQVASLDRAPETLTALPALLDASERVDPVLQRFGQDPAGALRALEELRNSFAPHPQVLVALCVCRHMNGEVDEAVKLGQTVMPICFERGHLQLAGRVFKQLRREADRLGLDTEQILKIGDALLKKTDLAGAGAAYSLVIGRTPGETRATTGLMEVAAIYLDERGKPEAALKVYDYLLKHCPDPAQVGVIRESRERCHTTLAQPVA